VLIDWEIKKSYDKNWCSQKTWGFLIEREKAKEKEMVVKIGFKNRKEKDYYEERKKDWKLEHNKTKHRG